MPTLNINFGLEMGRIKLGRERNEWVFLGKERQGKKNVSTREHIFLFEQPYLGLEIVV